jgi:hypothetical protein
LYVRRYVAFYHEEWFPATRPSGPLSGSKSSFERSFEQEPAGGERSSEDFEQLAQRRLRELVADDEEDQTEEAATRPAVRGSSSPELPPRRIGPRC